MDLTIVFPVFPPRIDGIGDHTANLARAFSGSCNVTVLTGQGPHEVPPNVQVISVFDEDLRSSAAKLQQTLLESQPDWILLQYNPFSYGKWGFNPYVPKAIRHVAANSSSRIALMIHEPCIPGENLQFKLMRLWQRRQLDTLVNAADLVFFSITAWTKEYGQIYPDKRIRHLPIGSNIPVAHGGREDVRAKYGLDDNDVLLGVFGSGHPNRLFPFIAEAVKTLREEGNRAPLMYVGGSSDKLSAAFGTMEFFNAGKLSAEDVSRHLQAMDIYLCPFGKGVSSRRGSFMAGIEHGLPCVTTTGSQSDAFLLEYSGKAFLTSADDNVIEFTSQVRRIFEDADLRRQLGVEAQQLYAEEFKWDMIADRAISEMGQVPAK